MQKLIATILITLTSLPALAASPGAEGGLPDDKGWHFYRERLQEESKDAEGQPIRGQIPGAFQKMPSAKWLRENTQALIDNAMDNPTPENAAIAQLAMKAARQKAQAFAFASKLAFLKYPELQEGSYASFGAFRASKEKSKLEIDRFIKELGANEHTLIYFYDHNCPICAVASESLAIFAERYGWAIIPVNATGEDVLPPVMNKHKEFYIGGKEGVRLANQFGVEAVPTIAIGGSDDFVAFLSNGSTGTGDVYSLSSNIIETLFAAGRISKEDYERLTRYSHFAGENGVDFIPEGVGDIRNLGSNETNKVLKEAREFFGASLKKQ